MGISANDIFDEMMASARGAFDDGWRFVSTYAPTEFRKMAVQLEEIANNVAKYENDNTQGYSPETGKLLFKMQKSACESVLVAVTQLTLIAVQNAINAILKVLTDTFGGVIAALV